MKKLIMALFLVPMLAGSVFAEKVIYVHGFSPTKSNAQCQDKQSCEYWSAVAPVGDHVYVGYDGRLNPFGGTSVSGSVRLLAMLNKYCRADQGQSCRIVADSMGGYTTAGVISMYNRNNTYNINYTTQIVSAEGGTELGNLGDGALDLLNAIFGGVTNLITARDAIEALAVSYARGLFDHNRNNGTNFYHVAGTKTNFLAGAVLLGKDDGVIPMHSSCGYRNSGAFSRCGGEKIRTCGWCFWQRKKFISAWDNHYVHPDMPVTGLNIGHNDGAVKFTYQNTLQ